jgi:hypothetical protein
MKHAVQSGLLVLAAVVLATMAGCGGGGGGGASATPTSTLSGTAAAGAPIAGTVTIKDSLGAIRSVTIAADGKYTVDVSGMTAPFMMRAAGSVGGLSYSLYSAAVTADINGTVNITPLTDLIVANVASQIASTLYSSGNFSGLTLAALTQAETALRTRLLPVLTAIGLNASTDLLRATFNANHTGQDLLLDVLRVTVDPATAQATILNIINNQQIIDNLTTQADVTVADATGMATGLTDLQQIVAQFDALTTLFAQSLPAPTNPTLLALFDSTTFLLDGNSLTTFLARITSNPGLIGVKFTNVVLESISTTTAKVNFGLLFGNGKTEPVSFTVNKLNGVWRLAGNQRIAAVNVSAYATNRTAGSYHPGINTGLETTFDVGALSPTVHYLVVTGKGLPTTGGGRDGASAGVLLVDYNNGVPSPAQGPYTGLTTPRLTYSNGQTIYNEQLPLSDSNIGLMAEINETYTVQLYADTNATPSNLADDTLLATYTEVIGRRPYLLSELSVASFTTVTTTRAQVGAFAAAGGNLTVTWSLPTGLTSEHVWFFRQGASHLDHAEADVADSATSTTLTILAPTYTVTGSGVTVQARDSLGRRLDTFVQQ